ncbi:MAG: diaminopimelate epimerase [Planctomycetales bacterium]|nr:diaminopimelate epimerase [Planctomycetales bacterium]
MRFTKMHGAGNDYVYIDGFADALPERPDEVARQIADRHFGVGGDGLVLICPSEVADARMRMFNADGSEAEMCGNAIRCVAKYVYDHGIAAKDQLAIETAIGVLPIWLEVAGGTARRARVDMGPPVLAGADIPTTFTGEQIVDVPLTVGQHELRVTCVSMGNPHCVTYVDVLDDHWVLGVGPLVERDPHFPQRVNAEFVEVISPTEVRMRVWERGSGETLACGTGAAAVCVAGVLSGRSERRITVHLRGGDLELEWADDGHVYKTGPAVEVFSGEWQPATADTD